MTLTHVDLFAGIGGFSLAMQSAGVETVAAVEIDKYCQAHFARRFPDVKMFGDIQKVSGDDLRSAGFIPESGILTGGFPCTDISIAGRGLGLGGGQSGLFWEIVRLLDELQPRWFILENVPRLLSINGGRDMGAVLGALADCGYGIAWRVLDAQHFGVPQRRRRIFIVGHLGDAGAASAEVLFEPEGLLGNPPSSREAAQETAGSTNVSADERGATARIAGTLQSAHLGVPSAEEACDQLVISTLQGGGKRGYRIDAEAAAGGHLIVSQP